MKERKVAPILARMNPARAKEITDELARRRQITQAAGGI
jgi:flagellar motility protein MotE (MotC chaperone)